MPQFGSYTDGQPGLTTDELLVKRSAGSTVRLAADKLPVSAAAAATFVDNNAFNTYQEATDLAIAGKENVLTFQTTTTGTSVTRVGNTVSIPALAGVAGNLFDGQSWAMLSSVGAAMQSFGTNVSTGSNVGTITVAGPNNPTNGYVARGRSIFTSAATAGSHARMTCQPRIRWPETTSTLYGGFRVVFTWAPKDAVSGAVGFVGFNQTNIAANTLPSAYTGSRWGIMYDATFGDSNLKLYHGGTLIQDFGASWPANANETVAYQFDVWARPAPNYGAYYTLTNLITGATVTGSTTNIPLGVFDPFVTIVRDNAATATAVAFSTLGMAGNAYSALIVGDSTNIIPTPNTITGSTTLTKTVYANVDNVANSGSPITLTIDNTGYVFGDYIVVDNIGAGSVSFAGASGVTINADAGVPATLAQWQSGSLMCLGSNNWIRRA